MRDYDEETEFKEVEYSVTSKILKGEKAGEN
jgi:hypothetical protein